MNNQLLRLYIAQREEVNFDFWMEVRLTARHQKIFIRLFMATKICVIWGLNSVANEDYIQGPAEIPDDFAKQL